MLINAGANRLNFVAEYAKAGCSQHFIAFFLTFSKRRQQIRRFFPPRERAAARPRLSLPAFAQQAAIWGARPAIRDGGYRVDFSGYAETGESMPCPARNVFFTTIAEYAHRGFQWLAIARMRSATSPTDAQSLPNISMSWL